MIKYRIETLAAVHAKCTQIPLNFLSNRRRKSIYKSLKCIVNKNISLNILLAHFITFLIQVSNLLKPEKYENAKKSIVYSCARLQCVIDYRCLLKTLD